MIRLISTPVLFGLAAAAVTGNLTSDILQQRYDQQLEQHQHQQNLQQRCKLEELTRDLILHEQSQRKKNKPEVLASSLASGDAADDAETIEEPSKLRLLARLLERQKQNQMH